MSNANYSYTPNFIPAKKALAAILAEVEGDLEQKTNRMYGKDIPVPRLTAWYGTGAYSYSNVENEAKEMPPVLEAICAKLSKLEGVEFNSVLVNYYRDGADSVSFHADDEKELGPSPADVRIASLSFGAQRRFVLRHNERLEDDYIVDLESGSLLMMRGDLQSTHKHAVRKTAKAVGPRVNLTFRVVS